MFAHVTRNHICLLKQKIVFALKKEFNSHRINLILQYGVHDVMSTHSGCILLGLFWLFLFRFRNNLIHGILISKRTLLHVSDLDRYFHSNFLNRKPAATGAGGRVGFPAKNFPKERVFCLFRVNRIPYILFILLSEAE